MRALPYRVPSAPVDATPWTWNGQPLGPTMPGWDFESTFDLHRSVRIDVAAALVESGLDAGDPLAVHARFWATGSLIRHSGGLHQLRPDPTTGWARADLVATVRGADLAGELILETTLVQPVDREGTPFTACRAGSVLWRDVQRVQLEGSGGLLPLAPVRFGEHGLPGRAAWYVSLDAADWSAPAMGNLLVLLNLDNPAVSDAVAEAGDQAANHILWDALTVDVVCDLVGRALNDEEYAPPATDETGPDDELSTAALVANLVRGFLGNPGEATTEALHRLCDGGRGDPSLVRAQAQSRLRFPRSRS